MHKWLIMFNLGTANNIQHSNITSTPPDKTRISTLSMQNISSFTNVQNLIFIAHTATVTYINTSEA